MTEEEIILKYTNLVRKQARCFAPNSVCDHEDYMQQGFLALLKCYRKFNTDKAQLSTFCYPIIYREIKRYQYDKFKINTFLGCDYHIDQNKLWELIPDNLTDDEKQCVELQCSGYKKKEIAVEMSLSLFKINRLIKSAMEKIKESNLE